MDHDPTKEQPNRSISEGRMEKIIHFIMHLFGLDAHKPDDHTDHAPSTKRDLKWRLHSTIEAAETERDKTIINVFMTRWFLNIAIILQVILGALTTGLSSALSSNRVMTVLPILGGISTGVAAYIAKARGSGEPDFSETRLKNLDQFLRECRAFEDDHGEIVLDPVEDSEHQFNKHLTELRKKFEDLLGNTNGQLKHPQLSSSTPLVEKN